MKSKLAIISFVLSIVGLFILFFWGGLKEIFTTPLIRGQLFYQLNELSFTFVPLLEIFAFVTSIISIRQIKRSKLEGRNFAIASLVISLLLFVFLLIVLIIWIREFGGAW